MDTLVRISLTTKVPLSELLEMEPESLASVLVWLDEKNDAEQDAAKGR